MTPVLPIRHPRDARQLPCWTRRAPLGRVLTGCVSLASMAQARTGFPLQRGLSLAEFPRVTERLDNIRCITAMRSTYADGVLADSPREVAIRRITAEPATAR